MTEENNNIYGIMGAYLNCHIPKYLANFLQKTLQQSSPNWWDSSVFIYLSDNQRQRLKQSGKQSLSELDLAGLLSVLDRNWKQISYKNNIAWANGIFIKEMREIRNRWAHSNAEGFSTDDIYRDIDTLQRFAKIIDTPDNFTTKLKDIKLQIMGMTQHLNTTHLTKDTKKVNTKKRIIVSSRNTEQHVLSNDKKEISYGIHPAENLVKLFRKRPYQGQFPNKASLVVLGNDANYTEKITLHTEFFKKILEYHEDGVLFWEKYKVHHPFLLSSYPFDKRKDGVLYHRNFERLGLKEHHAGKVSFVELLDVPTIGMTSTDKRTFKKLLNIRHLQWLEEVVLTGNKKIMLVNASFFRDLQWLQQEFSFFRDFPLNIPNLTTYKINDSLTIFKGYSFSATQFPSSVSTIVNAVQPFLS